MGRIDGKPVPAEGLAVASFRHLTSARWTRSRTTTTSSSTPPSWPTAATGACGHGRCSHRRTRRPLATAEMRHHLHHRGRPLAAPAAKAAGRSTASANGRSRVLRRRNEIDDALHELEGDRRRAHPNEVEHIVLRTRPAKNHTPADDLVAAWRERAARHGLTVEALADVVGHQHGEQALDTDVLRVTCRPRWHLRGRVGVPPCRRLTALRRPPRPTSDRGPQPLLCGAQRLLELTDEFLASPHVVAPHRR